MNRVLAVLIALTLAVPSVSRACACGCGVFDVQTGGLLPTRPGGVAFLEYDDTDQNVNWSGASRAPAGANDDKRIRTRFLTAGARYMLDRAWGFQIEVPYWSRRVEMADMGGMTGTFDHSAAGDIRARGVYSGFSADMSSGLTFGVKLPSGDFQNPVLERDMQIGTGSTDLLLGAYRMGRLGDAWGWFASALGQEPVLIAASYRPGAEVNGAAGAYFDGWRPGGWVVAPLAQVIASNRWRDSGRAANAPNTGGRRVLLSPGLELGAGGWRADASVGFPVYQYASGNQLAAREFYRLALSRSF